MRDHCEECGAELDDDFTSDYGLLLCSDCSDELRDNNSDIGLSQDDNSCESCGCELTAGNIEIVGGYALCSDCADADSDDDEISF
ncbi:hypothetical protein GNE00_09190 [Pseudomonas sp. JL972]|uniref:hypothetical protein n=1 Tax=Stutzerimonas stutzeri group TaxID=136846 RepID=UPI00051D2218|nr:MULTISPECIES: hypothetical protein [Stutzerimonas stutzeri group]KGK81856.1 hypothetical protein DP64_15460 [Stutzerimonas degradans]MPS59124.1 hypothetical protein [Pseudomonas sp.]MTZ13912.1 hypothetical protein [Stutzerimonas degradans]QGW21543.1 hypothetical protein GOM96_11280 [Stutzerimonas degradans]